MIRAKFGGAVRSKTTVPQVNGVLAKVLCHNIVVLIQSMFELDIVPVFWGQGLLEQIGRSDKPSPIRKVPKMTITRFPQEFGCYRYKLQVEEIGLSGKDNRGEVVFVMRNPATTCEERDLIIEGHRTRKLCVKFAKGEGYGTLTEVNLFAYRAKDEKALFEAFKQGVDVVGPEENDQTIREVVTAADKVVVAWGNIDGGRQFRELANEQAKKIEEFLRSLDKEVCCLGRNSDESPMQLTARKPWELQPWP